MKKVLIYFAFAPILIYIVYIVGISTFVYTSPYWHSVKWAFESEIPFDSKKWESGSANGTFGNGVEPYRHRMVNDLFKKHPMVGKTKSEIYKILGEPTNSTDNTKYINYYWLTEEYGTDIDPIAGKDIVITYDESEIVSKAEVLTWGK